MSSSRTMPPTVKRFIYTFPTKTLYKASDNEDCQTLLKIARYLHYGGTYILPETVVEGDAVPENTVLPTVVFSFRECEFKYEGLEEIVAFFEKMLRMKDLVAKANAFAERKPDYRCNK